MAIATRPTLALIIVIIYYWFVRQYLYRQAGYIIRRLGLARHYPLGDINSIVELALGASSHVVFSLLLLLLIGPSLTILTTALSYPVLLFYGTLLGVCEYAL